MATNEEMSSNTKNLLLESGFKLFGEKGFHKSKLEDVAKAAGLSRGAIYWHFKDKYDFYKALLKKGSEIIAYDQITSLKNGDSPQEKIFNLLKDQLYKFLYDDKYVAIGKVYFRFEYEVEDMEFKKSVMNWQTKITKPIVMDIVKDGRTSGVIRDELSDDEIYAILSGIMGGLAGVVYGSTKIINKKMDGKKIIRAMLRTIFVEGAI